AASRSDPTGFGLIQSRRRSRTAECAGPDSSADSVAAATGMVRDWGSKGSEHRRRDGGNLLVLFASAFDLKPVYGVGATNPRRSCAVCRAFAFASAVSFPR